MKELRFVPPHQTSPPLTLNEAQVSIVLAAVSGGMLEIGENLILLSTEPARLALLKNADLLQMVRLERAAIPIDLMSYSPQDGQPREFLLHEDRRQTMLAVFNWTDRPRSHKFSFAHLGLPPGGRVQGFRCLEPRRLRGLKRRRSSTSGPGSALGAFNQDYRHLHSSASPRVRPQI
jgi:alpha-galactosidase